ncbi:hypothetical protein AYI70_g1536 [Smittium culicis]|uniref:Uncharacterized protein n=1 Tax=Smittium culicis TaxID=133412 RepID=A0A1R1YCA8_9FUNG|nr:hypothetical protein AYI70_g1536 [Smittium culicis]
MKVTISVLALACSTIFSAIASPVTENSLTNEQSNSVLKRSFGRHGGRYGYRHGRGHGYRRRYRRFGRDWFFDDYSDIAFINGLVYQPTEFYGQRFQYIYQNSPVFSNYWNTDSYFRRCWNTDPLFRDAWFASLYPSGYSEFRNGGIYFGYLDRFGYGRYGRHRRYRGHGGRYGGHGGRYGGHGGRYGGHGGRGHYGSDKKDDSKPAPPPST